MSLDFRKMRPIQKGFSRYSVHQGLLSRSEKLGEVRQIEIHRNPCDRAPSIKWAAFRLDGERVAITGTRNEAGAALGAIVELAETQARGESA